MRWLKEPFAQFALGGAVLFGAWALAQRGRGERAPASGAASAGVPGVPAAAEVSRTVTFDAPAVAALRSSFRARAKREPAAAELADLVEEAIDEEILFREGMARGLDRDDGVVRRRVVEKMTALVRPSAASSDPPRDLLRRWYQTYSHRFVRPAAVTFDQIFFDPQRHADAPAAAREALHGLAEAGASAPAGVGDPFMLPAQMRDKSDLELGHLYGETFARAVAEAPAGRWQGPVSSRLGTLLVRVVERRPQRLPPFEEVEKFVRADWLTVEMRGQRAAAEALLPRYDVVLPPELRAQIAAAPGLAPILARSR